MKSKIKFKQILSLFIIFILISSLNIVISASGTPVGLNQDECYFFDDFSSLDHIDSLSNCEHNLTKRRITLKQSSEPIPFDYKHKPNSIELWETDRLFINGINQLIGPNLGDPTSDEEKDGIAQYNDGSVFKTKGRSQPQTELYSSPLHHFRFKVSKDLEEIDKISLEWWFGRYLADAELEKISLYLWDYQSIFSLWVKAASINYKESNINDPNGQFDLHAIFSPDEYISDDGNIDVLIVGHTKNNGSRSTLCSDYIKLEITTEYGYLSQGSVTSELISPLNLGQWDKVIWDGTKSTKVSNITVEILDKDDEVISGFKSKNSPLDISSLNKEEIKIKATLKTNSIDTTPKLNSWTVLYQSEDGFIDKFTSSFRIDELKGLKKEQNKIQVDSYYGDWSIYGKNPDNTRAYEGMTINKKPSGYYWFTYVNKYGGGGFRGPVVSDGVVYVASADNRIYSFNEISSVINETQEPIDKSKASYVVDSSLALSEDYVIFGTNSKDENNKVYALDKSNLTKKIWDYAPNDGDIAFTSAPNLYEDYVIISSSSGKIWDTPFFSIFGSLLNSNSKLIVLDEKNGEAIYDPIDLPAASHSTPAVADGKIFVACQNIKGSNLFAYDLYTGEELWNISTGEPYGIVGKSSPVYADGKVFVTCNQKDSIFESGKNMLISVDASDGEVLWNKSIGVPKISYIDLFNGIYTSAPIFSPCFYEETLFTVSTNGTFYALNPLNGEEKWSYLISDNSPLSGNFYASPLVVKDKVYVIKGRTIFCFDTKQSDSVEVDWSYTLPIPGDVYIGMISPPMVYSSPVYADGLLIISATHDYTNLDGALYCIGEYEKNLQGDIKSSSIEVPNHHWWEEFNADTVVSNNNTILFSILDENDNVLDDFKNINGSSNNISSLKEKKIKIYADFNVKKPNNPYPVLNSWSLDWGREDTAPVFNVTQRKAWVNEDLLEFSVSAEDKKTNSLVSGLDISSAKYRLSYIPTGKSNAVYSDWINAYSSAASGVKKATITAKIVDANLDIKELLNIKFKISDLAGNNANTSEISFKFDGEKPTSEILNKNDINDNKYNSEFLVDVQANDTGGSGIEKVFLKYQYSNSSDGSWSNWKNYSSSSSIFSWWFGLDYTLESGYYKLISVAHDNASNMEDISEDKAVVFLFDTNPPSIDKNPGEYSTSDVPIISFEISDDFKLDKLYYQTESDSDWSLIKEDINKKTSSVEWTVPNDIWVDLIEDQEYLIYFKLTDIAGNEYTTDENYAATIIKNTNDTNAYLDTSEFSELQTDDKFEISVKNIDNIEVENAKLFYKYSKDNKKWDDEWTQFGETKTDTPYKWEFNSPNGNGHYKFYTAIKDTQGKTHVSNVEEANVSVFPMFETIIFFVLVVLAIIVTLFVNARLKNKKEEL